MNEAKFFTESNDLGLTPFTKKYLDALRRKEAGMITMGDLTMIAERIKKWGEQDSV